MTRSWRVRGGHIVRLEAALLAAATVVFATGTVVPAAAKTAVSIKPSARVRDFTRSITISGRLASHRSGVNLQLFASEFPFAGAAVVGQKSTKKGGYYRFRVRPDLATRYVVARSSDPTVQSKRVTVYRTVHRTKVKCNLCGRIETVKRGSQTLRLSFKSRYPALVYAVESTKPHFFYYGQRNGSVRPPAQLGLVQTIAPLPIANNTISVDASYQIQLPANAFSLSAVICSKSTVAFNGFGEPDVRHCGDPTITRQQIKRGIG